MIDLLLLASTCSVFMEDWSYVESLYAWFTTFTTITFGDYIHLDSFARKAARGEIADYLVVLYGLFPVSRISWVLVLFPVFWAVLLTRWRMSGVSVIGELNSSITRLCLC